MLQIKQLCKQYRTGDLVQKALDHVDLNLRDNEFVAILGPSGSGKTTLLNIIGGLDRYDSGDLIINGISTKKYKDRDWDSYRNHTIGFVFQSYNLIPHQTLLANVELALTISGIGRSERRERAMQALAKVGLGEQVHKKPNQLSGGQMQRVAIARALVNDPDILLADEPTGALDSNTSVQVMDLLKEVAKDRLVVMVTHNPELAKQYATRIVNLRDGQIRSDSDPFIIEEAAEPPRHKKMGKASMSFLTALSLSFNNLRTKKARTLLTAFAGSIGIIGIALILALSTGVNDYIKNVETETLSQYPLQIQSTGLDLSSMMMMDDGTGQEEEEGDVDVIEMVSNMFSTMDSNDLKSLKTYLDSGESGVEDYTTAVEYSYNVAPQIFTQTTKDGKTKIRQVNPDKSFEALGFGSSMGSNSMMSSMMGTDIFYEMPEDTSLYKGQYDVKAGRWPENYNECVVVLTSGGSISDFMLYTLGLRDAVELDDMIEQFIDEETVETPGDMGSYSYEDILGITFKLVNSADYYEYDEDYEVWTDKSDNKKYMKKLVADGEDITVVGIVQPSEDANGLLLNAGIAYPPSLTDHVIENASGSEIVQEQLANKKKNIFTGKKFGKTGKKNEFNMDSLFTVDEDAFQDLFNFDLDGLFGGSGDFDLSDMFGSGDSGSIDLSRMLDPDKMNFKLPEMKNLDLDGVLSGVDMTVSTDAIDGMAARLIEGYLDYTSTHPEADYANLGQYFLNYLSMESARKILNDNLLSILADNDTFAVSDEELQQLFKDVLTGYQQYATEKGYTDPSKFDEYLLEYLRSDAGKAILNRWGSQIIEKNGNFTVSDAQLKKLASDLAAGYTSYAKENGTPNPADLGKYFKEYLGTEDAQKKLSSGISDMIDTGKLKKNLKKEVKKGVNKLTDEYSDDIQTLMNAIMSQIMNQIGANIGDAMSSAMSQLGSGMGDMMNINGDAFADAFSMNMDFDEMAELMTSMSTAQSATYENNLRTLGYADFAEPSEIDIYPVDFSSKEKVVQILDDYNARMEADGKEEQVITYTDMVGTLMSSVTNIVDIISYVLIAFVAISLVVSSIMIGVITYISVLERKKEIGILRAIGASKRNISQVFNAETIIIGLCAGLIGIGLTLLLLIPANSIIHQIAGNNDVNAVLMPVPAVILILLSIGLTLLGGLIPSKKAAKSDPVTALRTE